MVRSNRYILLVLVMASAMQLTATCQNADCIAKDAELKALSDRLANIELVLGFGMDLDETKETEHTRLISDVFVELKMLRKEFLNRFKHVRTEIKEHASDITKIKTDFDALCSMLGNPKILESLGHGAESVYSLLVSLNKRIDSLEKNTAPAVVEDNA